MKRWVWLLAVPYVVHVDSFSAVNFKTGKPTFIYVVERDGKYINSAGSLDVAEDEVEALNEAHERRLLKQNSATLNSVHEDVYLKFDEGKKP